MSSLNIELVHIILTAVSSHTVGTPKSKDNYKVYMDYDHNNKNKFVIDNIEIADKSDWDVDTVIDDSLKARRSTMGRKSIKSPHHSIKDDEKLIINEDI